MLCSIGFSKAENELFFCLLNLFFHADFRLLKFISLLVHEKIEHTLNCFSATKDYFFFEEVENLPVRGIPAKKLKSLEISILTSTRHHIVCDYESQQNIS